MTKFYFFQLGFRDPIENCEEIIWFLEQLAKTTYKHCQLSFWINIKQTYCSKLLSAQAYELYAFIDSKSTSAQEKKRIAARKKAKEKAELEMANFRKDIERRKALSNLLKAISLN
jgi:hypothetical protein